MKRTSLAAPLLLAALLLAATAAAPAPAQEDGVFVDPDSPAGKEYALPLDQARRDAAGGRAPSDGGGQRDGGEPLFGAGIEGAQSPSQRLDGAGHRDAENAGKPRPRRNGGGEAEPVTANNPNSAAIAAAAGESSDTLSTAGIVAAVLAAGLLAGLALRKLLRSG